MKFIIYISMILSLSIVLSSCMDKKAQDDTKMSSSNESKIMQEGSEDEDDPQNDQPELDDISGMVVSDSYSLGTSGTNIITVDNFGEMKSISSPTTLTGTAPRSWFFEGSFNITLMTLTEEIVAEVQAVGEWLEPLEGENEILETDMVPYTATLSFDAPTNTDEGKIRFSKVIVGDDAQEDLVDAQIIFAEGGTEITEGVITEESPVEEEVVNEESVNEETDTEEVTNEEPVSEETITEESTVEEEIVNEEPIIEEEIIDEEPANEETTTEEVIITEEASGLDEPTSR